MKDPSKLLQMMFETDRWQNLLDDATEKGIDLKTIKICKSNYNYN